MKYIFTEEHKRKLRESKKGKNNPFYGRKHTPETKRKISLSKIGKKQAPETVEKRRLSNTGKKRSPKAKMNLSKGVSKAIQEGRLSPPPTGISGWFYSKKNKKKIHYRSLLELHWYQLLEQMSKVKRYSVEPVIIPYIWGDSIHHYIPDLRIRYADKTTELVEIKPEDKWNKPRNIAKFKAAQEWCKNRRIPTTFRVVGYEGLN